MDLNVVFKDFFSKTDEEKDEILSNLTEEYLNACIDNFMNVEEIIAHIDRLIEGYTFQEKYEQAAGFKRIKDVLMEVYTEHEKRKNGM